MFATVDDLRSHLSGTEQKTLRTPEYEARMMHPIPPMVEVDRIQFILEKAKGKKVLEFGASGVLHTELCKVATVTGVDLKDADVCMDLDAIGLELPDTQPDIVVCGEIIEHLANPGYFLSRLVNYGVPIVLSVPNAFTSIGASHLKRGIENVNIDHVAWYSPTTLTTLLGRYGYTVNEMYWYNGSTPTAEGIIVVVRATA